MSRDGAAVPDGASDTLSGIQTPSVAQTLTYTVANNGNGELQLLGQPMFEVTAMSNATAYVIVMPGDDTVAPGSQEQFTLQLTPISTGTYSAEVTIESNDPAIPEYVFTVEGETTSEPAVGITYQGGAIAHNGTANVGYQSTDVGGTLDFTLENHGEDDLTNVAVTVAAAVHVDATVSAAPATSVDGGASEPFTIDVSPRFEERFSFEIHVESNDPVNDPFRIRVEGRGIAGSNPAVRVSRVTEILQGSTDELGNLLTGDRSDVFYSIANAGAAELSSVDVAITDEDNCSVTLLSAPASSVDPNEATSVVFGIEPSADGPFSFTLTVESNDPGSPSYAFTVSGNATSSLEGNLQLYSPGGSPISAGGSVNLAEYASEGFAEDHSFVIANRGTEEVEVTIPVFLSAVSGADVTIPYQPGAGPSVSLAPQAYTAITVRITPHSPAQSSQFTLHVNSDDPNNPSYTATATLPGEESEPVTAGDGGGCGMHAHTNGASILQVLGIALILLTLTAIRRQRTAA